jgi:hypothetical protein
VAPLPLVHSQPRVKRSREWSWVEVPSGLTTQDLAQVQNSTLLLFLLSLLIYFQIPNSRFQTEFKFLF